MTMRILDTLKVKGCGDAAVDALAACYQRLYEGTAHYIDEAGAPGPCIPKKIPLRHIAPQILTACDLAAQDLKRFAEHAGSRRFQVLQPHHRRGMKILELSASEIKARAENHIGWFRQTAQSALEERRNRWVVMSLKEYQQRALPREVVTILRFFLGGTAATKGAADLILSAIWNRMAAVAGVATLALLVGGGIYHRVQAPA